MTILFGILIPNLKNGLSLTDLQGNNFLEKAQPIFPKAEIYGSLEDFNYAKNKVITLRETS